MISPLAHVDPNAKIGEGVTIHPFAYIDEDVVIGDGCTIMPYASIIRGTRMGKNNKVYQGAVIGADGFGLSDTRPAVRRHFHIDGPSIAYQALRMLADRGQVPADTPTSAFEKYRLDDVNAGTSGSSGGDA